MELCHPASQHPTEVSRKSLVATFITLRLLRLIPRAPPPEPLREGALVFAPIAVQTTRRTLYKQLLAQVQTQSSHQSTPVQRCSISKTIANYHDDVVDLPHLVGLGESIAVGASQLHSHGYLSYSQSISRCNNPRCVYVPDQFRAERLRCVDLGAHCGTFQHQHVEALRSPIGACGAECYREITGRWLQFW